MSYKFQCRFFMNFLHLAQKLFVFANGFPPLAFCIIQSVSGQCRNPCVPGSIPGGTTYKESFFGVTLFLLLLSGKIKNAVANGLRSALPLARARKPNNHIAQGAALGYVILPLRGVLFMSFDTLTSKQELLQYCFVGALLALASGKAERRQVHPLSVPPFASAVRSDSVRRPIGFRSVSDQIAFAVRSDSVRRPIRLRSVADNIS